MWWYNSTLRIKFHTHETHGIVPLHFTKEIFTLSMLALFYTSSKENLIIPQTLVFFCVSLNIFVYACMGKIIFDFIFFKLLI